ncbi:LCP family protein [Metabacillus halosaccharovorans]|uniref:LCP family protein n=1 Tax=Metabacillus halosaccharovorans TaxID=930124 RepID=UPI000994E583|nr:LCP family protein [Metabacillus halosaccharovorans]
MNQRQVRHKKKKKKKVARVFFLLLLLIIGFGGYIFYQYYTGLQAAGEGFDKSGASDFAGAEVGELGKINVLLLGVDSRGEEKSRTDTIMIAQYDPKEGKAKLVSIMRDTYVEIPDYKNYKINTAYFLGGPELLRETLEKNLGVDLHYYALVDFKGFQQVVDTLAPNGIEIDVQQSMSKNIGVSLEPGVQMLDGAELLGYARYRADAKGDFGRVERQQEVINALKDELISVNGVTKLPKLVGTVQPYIETNVSGSEVLGLLKDFIVNTPEDIETMTIPVEGSYTNESYSHAGSVLEIDMEENKAALDEFLNGPSSVVTSDSEQE